MKALLLKSFQTFLFLFLLSEAIASDYGSEIITASFNKSLYYLVIYDRGDSVSKDLKYYSESGEFIQNVLDRVRNSFNEIEGIKIYKNLEIINLSKFEGYSGAENELFILNNQLIHLPSGFIENIKVIDVIKSYNQNYTFSPDLKTEDNEWISKSRIKKYWDFDDGEVYCQMSLFGIEDSISTEQLNIYKSKLNEMWRSPYNPVFIEFLKVLYRQKIIVIGICTC